MVTEDGQRSRSHGLRAEVLKLQAQAIGIPLIQRRAAWANYGDEYQKMMIELRKDGITGGVFGDIDFGEHRQWVEKTCREAGIIPHLPLWGESQARLLREFVALEFKAIVVAARADYFSEEILGQKVDLEFIGRLEEMQKEKDITICGEKGEYHTLVTSGPLFTRRLAVLGTRNIFQEGHWILEVLAAEVQDKGNGRLGGD